MSKFIQKKKLDSKKTDFVFGIAHVELFNNYAYKKLNTARKI